MKIKSTLFIALAATLSLSSCGGLFRQLAGPREVLTTPGVPQPSATQSPNFTPTPGATPTPDAIPTAAPTTTARPSTNFTATTSPSAEPTPSAAPNNEPTATPTPDSTPTPSPRIVFGCNGISIEVPFGQPTPSLTCPPTPTAQEDISIIEKTTFNGSVYDDSNTLLNGVRVTVKSLNSSVEYEAETLTTSGGTYVFNNAPAGVQLEITASRSGFTIRRRVEVLKSNKQGDPDTNRYDFSNNGIRFDALSDKPEVTMVTPARNAAGISHTTSFVLKFSEPMDRQTVVDAFQIRAFGSGEQLTVDNQITFAAGSASNGVLTSPGDLIWDKAAFNASWNSDDTEVTMVFKEERALPTDKDNDNIPDYSVSFDAGSAGLKDKSGITRSAEHFKLTEGRFENYYKFSIRTDEQAPDLDGIVAITAENSGANSDGDVIKLRFSERMIYYTLTKSVQGGMNGDSSESATNAANYFITITRNGTPIQSNVTWSSLTGGPAFFDSNDPTHKTVLLLPNGNDIYEPGDNVEVRVATTVLDPAGNSMSSSDIASAIAQ